MTRNLVRVFVVVTLTVLAPQWGYGQAALKTKRTALDDYVAKPDPTFSWTLVKTAKGSGVTTFVLDMKSQTWRTNADVDRTVWQHWVVISKPDNVEFDTALLLIGGGRNGGDPPDNVGAEIRTIANLSKSVVVELRAVPNQPLVFHGDGKPRNEDDLIGYCWDQFLKTGDATWLPRLPMTKSAVRAMDAVTEFLASEQGGGVKVDKFVVAGASKRGWTTWTTAIVDPRVTAIIPIVIDVLNVQKSMEHHFEAYGFWAPAIKDYVNHKITERMDTPGHDEILKICDPFSYRERLTMPKYIVNASGDEFFVPDSSQFYFDELPAPKYLRYVPNANHSLKGTDAVFSIHAFYDAILKKTSLPQFGWTMEKDGSITVTTKDAPKEVNLWQATNPKARDFRIDSIGKAFTKTTLNSASDGKYVASVDKPESGWTAFFVELVFDVGGTFPLKFTTQVSIVPDKLPHSIEEYRQTLRAGK